MGGRPSVVGLLAAIAAVLLASLLAASPACAQMRIPLFGDAKPKVVKKRPFRPTLPYRNPMRVTAGVTASADPPAKAENSEVAAAVGTSSTASVSVALAAPQPDAPEAPTPAARGSESSDDSSNAADTETSQNDDVAAPQDVATPSSDADTDLAPAAEDTVTAEASDESAGDTTSGVASDNNASPEADTADAPQAEATPTPEAQDAAKPPADVEETTHSAADEPATAPNEAKQTQTIDTDAEESSTPPETAEASSKDDAPEPTAATDASDEAAPPVPSTTPASDETLTPAETEQATASADAAPAVETAKPAAAPSHDASVVLKVSPPPDAAKAASAAAATDQTPGVVTLYEGSSSYTLHCAPNCETPPPVEIKETQTASLTPPNAPVPDAASPAEDEQPATAEAGPDSNAADSEKATKTPDEEANQPATAQEAKPSDENTEPAVESPPAHPVVAAIRTKLDEPSFQKSVSKSERKALEEFYGRREGPPLWITDDGFTDKAKALIAEIGKADDWGLEASDFDVPRADAHPPTKEGQAAAELKLDLAALKYARYAEGGRRAPSSYSSLFDQRPPIRSPKKVLTEIAAASAPDAYLTSLQPQHEQFKRLHQALLKARAKAKANGTNPSNDRDVQLIVMNMERWRWLPRHLGTLYVWDNVPEFNTRVIKNGKTIYVEKTIVGQLKYATPLFSAPMRNIVFHPNWTVPPTIVNEDLAPALQGDGGFFGNANTAILRNHGLKVSLRGEPVDPDTVDWKNVNVRKYTFTQDPGPDNVLGQLKFNFPNRHAIYMHDTVQPELFDQTVRALSHGCIRVHAPDRFAAALLAQDKGWSMAQVRDLLAKSASTVVPLSRRIPVHITYFTAVVDEHGNVNKLGDIYGIDNRMAAKMFANPARFPIPATPDVEANNRPPQGGGLDSIISGLFGN